MYWLKVALLELHACTDTALEQYRLKAALLELHACIDTALRCSDGDAVTAAVMNAPKFIEYNHTDYAYHLDTLH